MFKKIICSIYCVNFNCYLKHLKKRPISTFYLNGFKKKKKLTNEKKLKKLAPRNYGKGNKRSNKLYTYEYCAQSIQSPSETISMAEKMKSASRTRKRIFYVFNIYFLK